MNVGRPGGITIKLDRLRCVMWLLVHQTLGSGALSGSFPSEKGAGGSSCLLSFNIKFVSFVAI